MKKVILSIAMILFTTSIYAKDPFDVTDDNPDLYDGLPDSRIFPTLAQSDVGDNYASSALYRTGVAQHLRSANLGSDDAYGSVVLDVGHPINW